MKPLNPYLSPGTPADPAERRRNAEEMRDILVTDQAFEIICNPGLLDDAVADFGNTLSFTGIYELLANIACSESDSELVRQSAELRTHLHSIAKWRAERITPPVPIFL